MTCIHYYTTLAQMLSVLMLILVHTLNTGCYMLNIRINPFDLGNKIVFSFGAALWPNLMKVVPMLLIQPIKHSQGVPVWL